jgi:hypothetical protein
MNVDANWILRSGWTGEDARRSMNMLDSRGRLSLRLGAVYAVCF